MRALIGGGIVVAGLALATAVAAPPASRIPGQVSPTSPSPVVRTSASALAASERYLIHGRLLAFSVSRCRRAGVSFDPAALFDGGGTTERVPQRPRGTQGPSRPAGSVVAAGAPTPTPVVAGARLSAPAAERAPVAGAELFVRSLADAAPLDRLIQSVVAQDLAEVLAVPTLRVTSGVPVYLRKTELRPVLFFTPGGGLAWTLREFGTAVEVTVSARENRLALGLHWRHGVLDGRPEEWLLAPLAEHDSRLESGLGEAVVIAAGEPRPTSQTAHGASHDWLAAPWLVLEIAREQTGSGGSQAPTLARPPQRETRTR